MKTFQNQRYLLWLLPPLLLYVVPLLMGYAWNSMFGPNVLNPPEGYHWRVPSIPITAESWGSAVVIVPFHARLGEFLRSLTLPLWNPYQGLGQPFAAQGEGSPYFPLAILRALLPYSWSNWVTVGMFALAGAFVTAFLRALGLGTRAALFGGVAFTVSGIVLPHIARDNIADQLCMAPILFWATAAVIRERTASRFAILAVVSALNAQAGFIQIGMLATVLAGLLVLVEAHQGAPSRRAWLGRSAVGIGALAVGGTMTAFALLPMLETMTLSHTQNLRLVFLNPPVPIGNGVSFFLPLVFGHPFTPSWIWPSLNDARSMPDDWNDLFGFVGLLPLVAALGGLSVRSWRSSEQRAMYYFFFVASVLLLLRYLSIAPFDLTDLFPPFFIQTRKHANGLTALCLILAAAIALGNADTWRRGRALAFQLVAILYLYLHVIHRIVSLALSDRAGVMSQFSKEGIHFLTVTLIATLLVMLPFVLFALGRLSVPRFQVLVIGAAVAEAIFYVPLGYGAMSYLYGRAGIAVLVFGAVAIGVVMPPRLRVLAVAPLLAAVVAYGAMIARLPAGLPHAYDTDNVPRFMAWLQEHAGSQYRTFGIFPDFSSIGGIQDLGVVGPLAPRDFRTMVGIVADEGLMRNYDGSPIFMMAGRLNFAFKQYVITRPVLDWLGVRYIVLDKAYFNESGRKDDALLREDTEHFAVVYEDERSVIIESSGARPKAELWSAVKVLPDQNAITTVLRESPETALGPPLVEEADRRRIGLPEADAGQPVPVSLDEYHPNRVLLSVDAPASGLVVLKDVYMPGWGATVDGRPAEVVRVDGMVRGVVVTAPGHHQIEFSYWPATMNLGLALAGVAALLVLGLLVRGLVRPPSPLPAWAVVLGFALATALLASAGRALLIRPA